jgi:transposase
MAISIRIGLRKDELKRILQRLQVAYVRGEVRLIKRIQALLYALEGKALEDIAEILSISRQSIYKYVNEFILYRLDSFIYKRPPGRPSKLTKSQKKTLGDLIDKGPEEAGYDYGCWTTALIQDLIKKQFGVEYCVHYVAELLKNMGFSYQKAIFVSEHIEDVAGEQEEWMEKTWPEILKLAKEKGAMILFGDEASFAQWGSLSYTWSRKGRQPVAKTSGKRKAYKVFGLIDYFSGAFFSKSHTGRFNSLSYENFLKEVLEQTKGHLIIIQDGASYHTSKAMRAFFAKHTDRLTVYQLPRYSPKFNPIEYLWRNVKKEATHLRYFPTFDDLKEKVDEKLHYFAQTPRRITNLMGKYCKTLGTATV